MTVQIINADLFRVKSDAYAHGVNCQGKMGKGVAVEFKKRWPEMYKAYQKKCAPLGSGAYRSIPDVAHPASFVESMAKQSVYPGEKMLWKNNDIVIANLFIQDRAMSNCAKYWALEQSLIEFAHWLGTKWTYGNIYDKYKSIKSIAMPFIGCGIGGLHKDGVEAIVRHVFDDWDGVVYICDLDGLKAEERKQQWQHKKQLENSWF